MMKVAFLASEAVPFAKTSGLADVTGALPQSLVRQGIDVRLLMPLYREVRKIGLPLNKVIEEESIEFGGRKAAFSVWEPTGHPFPVYFIEKDEFYDRDGLYGSSAGDYPDNGERFGFFSKASLAVLRRLNFSPDVVHSHDWQSAAALAYLKFAFRGDPLFRKTKSLFTIHNLACQGLFEKGILEKIDLPPSLFEANDLEFKGQVSFLKAGLLYSTAISTVSPRYSREIQTPEFGCGLDGHLRDRSRVLFGLLNGVDYALWDPSADRLIPAAYGLWDLAGKRKCRDHLLRTFGLSLPPDAPLAGIVSRLTGQKGVDIVCEAFPALFKLGLGLVLLGTGEESLQNKILEARRAYPLQLGVKIAFDEKMAHAVFAGSDLLLVPSRFEPCGLTQMYGFKYGAIPIARATGGLDDSIQEYDAASETGNGFKFDETTSEAICGAVRKALATFRRPAKWANLVRNAMAADFSWEKAAQEYRRLYIKILTF